MRNFICLFLVVCLQWSCQIGNLTIHDTDLGDGRTRYQIIDRPVAQQIFSNDDSLLMANDKAIIVELENPSFEDSPSGHSFIPIKWKICSNTGFPKESPPDIHGNDNRFFYVKHSAPEGKQFLGLVARDNRTSEHIAQVLEYELVETDTYMFSLDLTYSKDLVSVSRSTNQEANFDTPLVLKIWGGTDACDRDQLLYLSESINHTDWKTYFVKFTVEQSFDVLILEASFDEEYSLYPYNGNILIDNVSPIYQVGK